MTDEEIAALLDAAILQTIYLIPPQFGGREEADNMVLLPQEQAAQKWAFDQRGRFSQ